MISRQSRPRNPSIAAFTSVYAVYIRGWNTSGITSRAVNPTSVTRRSSVCGTSDEWEKNSEGLWALTFFIVFV